MAEHVSARRAPVPRFEGGFWIGARCGYQMTETEAMEAVEPTCEVCLALTAKEDLCQRLVVAIGTPVYLASRPAREDLVRDVKASDVTVEELLQYVINRRF